MNNLFNKLISLTIQHSLFWQDNMAIITYGDYLNFKNLVENDTTYNALDNFIHTVSKQPKLCLLYGWNGIIATRGIKIFTWDDNRMRYVQ